MAQPDYRESIYDDGDNNVTEILNTIVGRVPGAVAGYVSDTLRSVIKTFYRQSFAWREFVDIGVLTEAMMPYEINPLRDRALKAHSITSLARNGQQITQLTIGTRTQWMAQNGSTVVESAPTAFYTNPPTQINFLYPLATTDAKWTATVIVVPLMKSNELPQWCIDNHEDAFIAGTLHRLHNEVKKPYTDPYKAMYHGKEWRYYINQHKAIADKNYGDAQHDWQFPRGTQ